MDQSKGALWTGVTRPDLKRHPRFRANLGQDAVDPIKLLLTLGPEFTGATVRIYPGDTSCDQVMQFLFQ